MKNKTVYNLKSIHYLDHDQIRLYSKPFEDVENINYDIDYLTGEIIEKQEERKKKEYELTPWGDEVKGYFTDEKLSSERSALVSMNRTISNVYGLSRSNKWEWFFTLTFNPLKVDRTNYTECSKKLSTWLENMRRRYSPDMVYLLVPELHKDGKSFHFHGLFSNIGNMPLFDSGKRDKQGRIIYNIGSYYENGTLKYAKGAFRLGFTTVTAVDDTAKASSYLCKYITKDLCSVTFNKRRYWASKNINRAKEDVYLVEDTFLSRLQRLGEIDYLKTVENAYCSCTYVELKGRLEELKNSEN